MGRIVLNALIFGEGGGGKILRELEDDLLGIFVLSNIRWTIILTFK